MPSRFLRIASYNIRKAIGTDRRRDPDRIFRIIRSFQADIVVLQEVDKRLPPRHPALPIDRVQEQTGLVAVQYRPDTPSLGEHGNALLIDPAMSVEDRFTMDLPGLEPRGMVGVRLKSPNGRSFCVIGMHLGLLRFARRRQIRSMFEWLDASDMKGLPTIVAGDLNERSRTDGLGQLQKRLSLLPACNSFHARLPKWPLDRIAVSQHFLAAPPRVILDEDTRLASDHLPIIADLEWLPTDAHECESASAPSACAGEARQV